MAMPCYIITSIIINIIINHHHAVAMLVAAGRYGGCHAMPSSSSPLY